jgi:glutamate racemase
MTEISPIGVFDSGFGGLTIFKKIRQLLPHWQNQGVNKEIGDE